MKYIPFLFLICTINAQSLKYEFLASDQYDIKWYYSFDKKNEDGFYSWIKNVEKIESNPTTESTEYYIQFKCNEKTMSDQIQRTNWRNNEEPPLILESKKIIFKKIPENSITMKLFKKYCKK